MATSAALLDRLLTDRITVFNLQRRRFPAGQRMEPVVVPSARLLLIEQGEMEYHLDGAVATLAAGSAILVPALAKRWWRSTGRAALTMSWIEFLLQGRTPSELPALIADLDPDGLALELEAHARISAAHARRDLGGRLLAEAELRAMVARLATSPRLRLVAGAQRREGADDGVRRALAWLERHYAERSPERGLAQRAGMSPGHFRLRFRAGVGMSPRAFVRELRLHAALGLLAAGTLDVKQVAALVGYPDALHFSRQYRRRWSVPPSRHRETD
jgi:AraC-like DNA-binding protein